MIGQFTGAWSIIPSIVIVLMIPSIVIVLWCYGSRKRGNKANPIKQRILQLWNQWISNPNYFTRILVYADSSSAVYCYTVSVYCIVYYTLQYNLREAYTESR